MSGVQVAVTQISETASRGTVRGHNITMDRPEAKGGTDAGAMGGEVLLLALGGCFMSNLLAAIQAREAKVSDVTLSIAGTLEGTPPRFSAVAMDITARHGDAEQLQKLVTIAERGCIVANTLKPALDLTIRIGSPEDAPA